MLNENGYFDDENREFVIKNYKTERPWINYLTNGRYCTLISQTGGGYSFWVEPKFSRITKYRYDNHPQDRPGRYLYIYDNDDKNFWSNGWQPVMVEPTAWECRHGLGYTKIASETNGIRSEITYFVPTDDECEVWVSKVKNVSDRKRSLKITPYVEFALFNAEDEYRAYPNLRYFNDAKFDPELNAILYFMHHHSWVPLGKVFMGLTEPITGYSVDRRHFFGNYRSETNPKVIESKVDHNRPVLGSDCCGAPSFELELMPGEEKEFQLVLGVDQNIDGRAKQIMEKFSDRATVQRELKNVKDQWLSVLSNFSVETPDAEINSMVNVWNQYQCKVTFDWSRWASYYHTGTYRGIGFRDTSQDCLGTLHTFPQLVREKILLLARNMFSDGHSHHSFFADGVGDGRKYGDDHLWIANAVYHYIHETADLSILDEITPYTDGGEGSIFEHMRRSLEYAFRESGPHGFPKMFFADWNDCLNDICVKEKGEKGESVMVAMQLYHFGNYLLELAELSGKTAELGDLKDRLEALKDRINEIAWDGQWYQRAYTDEGRVIGSSKSEEAQIWLNAQSWAVLSGVAEGDRATTCMDSVFERLNTDFGIKLLDPPFTKFPLDVGSIIHYPGGIKENAGIFCHANTWAIIAETKLKRADRSFKFYEQTLPPKVSKKVGFDRYRVEPYVYTQFITGPDHPDHGSASHSWLTGTSVWSFVAISQHILGIKPTFHGLKVDPCIPNDWDEYRITRKFRSATYNFHIKNPDNISHGVKEIKLNGKSIGSGVVIPVQSAGSENELEVILG